MKFLLILALGLSSFAMNANASCLDVTQAIKNGNTAEFKQSLYDCIDEHAKASTRVLERKIGEGSDVARSRCMEHPSEAVKELYRSSCLAVSARFTADVARIESMAKTYENDVNPAIFGSLKNALHTNGTSSVLTVRKRLVSKVKQLLQGYDGEYRNFVKTLERLKSRFDTKFDEANAWHSEDDLNAAILAEMQFRHLYAENSLMGLLYEAHGGAQSAVHDNRAP